MDFRDYSGVLSMCLWTWYYHCGSVVVETLSELPFLGSLVMTKQMRNMQSYILSHSEHVYFAYTSSNLNLLPKTNKSKVKPRLPWRWTLMLYLSLLVSDYLLLKRIHSKKVFLILSQLVMRHYRLHIEWSWKGLGDTRASPLTEETQRNQKIALFYYSLMP